jgi:ATP-binding cassette, subfamily B, bacterial CvaB/MchF/RaxB
LAAAADPRHSGADLSAAFLNLSGVRKLPLIRQVEAAECGLACLAMVAGYHGYEAPLSSLRQRFSISMKGATLKSLVDIAAGLGLGSRAVRAELEELKDLRLPAVLHWDLNHFVVLKRVGKTWIEVHDPALGERRLRMQDASKSFTGVALELTPAAGFQRKRERQALQLSTLVKLSPDAMGALFQALVVTLIIETLVLVSPFYMQLVIDEAILKGDEGLLTSLAIGFALVVVFQVVANALRALVLQYMGSVLSFEMEARLFHHLIRLPLSWFHKRQVGDIQSRFQAVEPIKQFVAGGAIAAVFDGVFGLLIAIMMVIFAPVLAVIVFASVALYILVRLAMLELSKRVAGDYLVADAKEQTGFLETLRAAQTLKLAASETTREGQHRNAIAATLNSGIRGGNVNIGYGALKQAIMGLTDVAIIFLGAKAVMSNQLTVGMLTAFIAYKGQFVQRATGFLEALIAWRLLDVQLERLADIALSPKEANMDVGGQDGEIIGALEVRNIYFRYAPGEPEVLRGVSFAVAPGEFVAIAGASGCGKSTLLKIVTGLYAPSYGEVFLDGRPLAHWNQRAVRAQIGTVMQDDVLLAGSIAENVAFFDERIDMARVIDCARMACIHDDITRMPMAYQTLVGDMGTSLSGGQQQRVMIARALYRQPKILIMDEGTSHLDVETERAINAALSQMPITRIVVAHRPETIRAAARVLRMDNGTLAAHPREVV